jgi:hypothetical protein
MVIQYYVVNRPPLLEYSIPHEYEENMKRR